MKKLSKAQRKLAMHLTENGGMIRSEISGYYFGARKIRDSTVDALIENGWCVKARIEPISGRKVLGTVVVPKIASYKRYGLIQYKNGKYGITK